MFLFDAHLDLAMNAMEWNRDLRWPVTEIRKAEHGMKDKPDRGNATVSLPALRKGSIGLVVATQIARVVKPGNELPGWHSPEQAWAQTQAQLAWYKAMERAGELTMITNWQECEAQLQLWTNDEPNDDKPIGYILSLEGADSLVTPDELDTAYAYGLRAVGPAHYGEGRYANGTNSSGKMNKQGLHLLRRMESLGVILDASHLCDDAFWQALDYFNGAVWASHSNCRALVPHNRQLSDEMILALIQRGAVIGMAFDAWMMVPAWQRGESTPSQMGCRLETIMDHIDHICQLAGNADHVAIGSDLDGAFGSEQCPADLDTIADMQLLPSLLRHRGYTKEDIEKIAHGNWLRVLKNAWSGK